MNQDQLFIQRCFELASLAAGKVAPNPRVGAVITYKNKIIGEGFHQFPGGPHAEVNAINSLQDKKVLPYSTIYISLEPCHNHGKTPPCVDTILHYKIPRVVIAMLDSNPLTEGKSVDKLMRAGVKVSININTILSKKISPGFHSIYQKNRPYVILKFAQSSNKKMGIAGENYWISNPVTKRLTHKWRSQINAIIVGTKTIITDDPKLNNRLYYGSSPLKLLIKRDGILPKSSAALQSKGETIIISATTPKPNSLKNVKRWLLPFDQTLLSNILENLKKEGYNSLLVEGGATLLNSFIQQNLWDEARIITARKHIHHPKSIPSPNPAGELVNTYQIGDNFVEIIKNNGSLTNPVK